MGSQNSFHSTTFSMLDDTSEISESEISEFSVDDSTCSFNTGGELDLEILASRMKHPKTGLKIKTRKWLLKKFPNCFIGEQAVTWICFNLEICDRKEAVAIGQRMENAGYFRHVTGDHP